MTSDEIAEAYHRATLKYVEEIRRTYGLVIHCGARGVFDGLDEQIKNEEQALAGFKRAQAELISAARGF